MEVNCEGCAGCCVDWRPVRPEGNDHERRGPRRPLDDAYNLVPLTRDEVRDFLDAGYGDALVPRLFTADGDETVAIDGRDLAALDGRPVFSVGLRKPPKPIGPFGLPARWLDACAFLDPRTLQCRIHGDDLYPEACADYPGRNLALGRETECERVEAAFGGERLAERSVPGDLHGPRFGPQAVGSVLFVHPTPDRLRGVVARAAEGALTAADRAEFVGAAVGSSPGTSDVNEARAASARERVLDADSWVGRAIGEWKTRAGRDADRRADPDAASDVEDARGAPGTPGW
ncbi:YkgJ family cysteine cluster protein [Halegenticoccus tardaugens]|uniref:YkgJ family cysteine cluster protein n=1 Tax=Halegenticoccus tardaugens TaxID=2071624 RepID=UPI00100BFCCA|nr:YkgJ family cysteine cluster protein [Halegenticoccus tardaugens]